jgi:hypothetical protein
MRRKVQTHASSDDKRRYWREKQRQYRLKHPLEKKPLRPKPCGDHFIYRYRGKLLIGRRGQKIQTHAVILFGGVYGLSKDVAWTVRRIMRTANPSP